MNILRLATIHDLPELKAMYQKIIKQMEHNNIAIWDEEYPCEFFYEDIQNSRLYVIENQQEILSAFALCETTAGASETAWESPDAKALYLDRFGVNTAYTRTGIGQLTLQKAICLARQQSASYLRLFVVTCNTPAIHLYQKSHFLKVLGIYNEVIDDTLTLQEYPFEIRTTHE